MDPRIKAGIFHGESGGDYDALFKYANRAGGPFAGKNVTGMTVDEAIQFTHSRGPYAQWVKKQIGRVATPVGAFQVVGNTLKQAKRWAGLRGDERMTQDVQDRIGDAILANQGTGAWKGYRGPRDPGKGQGAEARYDPRRDTPSTGQPVGSKLPSQYDLPVSEAGSYGGPGEGASHFGGGVAGGTAGLGTPATDTWKDLADRLKKDKQSDWMPTPMSMTAKPFSYDVPQTIPAGLSKAQPTPMIDPQSADMKRQMLAMALQKLNAGVLG